MGSAINAKAITPPGVSLLEIQETKKRAFGIQIIIPVMDVRWL